MIIWRGWGFMVLFIPTVVGGVINAFMINVVDSHYLETHAWAQGVSLFIGAIPLWFLGRYLNNRPGQVLIDPDSGEKVQWVKKHTLFFVPMQYYAGVWMLVALWMLVTGTGVQDW
ncbi:hypothetical protein FACS1894116_13150 [Betaproteobacteria bacterium]|nr:hypothetical protein FACS1894116_13150 [Betaproteobacteria bacterium]